jgi:hypothetical protein
MKAVVDSLNLKELIRPTDDIANFKCCSRIGHAEKPKKVQIFDSDYVAYCFTVSSLLADWELCATESLDI